MSRSEHSQSDGASLEIENIGGVREQTLSFDPGLTVLTGENATNRTSMLRAIMAVCGSDNAYLRAGTDTGRVTLRIGDDEYTRVLRRRDGAVEMDGAPMLTDDQKVQAVDLFAFLLADNEARRSIGADPRDIRRLVMQPVDTDAIERRKAELRKEIEHLEHQAERRTQLEKEELPTLKEQRATLDSEITELGTKLETTREKLNRANEKVEPLKKMQEQIETVTSKLQDARERRNLLDRQISNKEAAVAETRDELESTKEELEDVESPSDVDREKLETDLQQRRREKDQLDEKVDDLFTIIEFNEARLNDENTTREAVSEALESDGKSSDTGGTARTADDLTQQLTHPAEEQTIRCWTCGQEAKNAQIQGTVDTLRNELTDLRSRRTAVQDEIDEFQTALQDHRQQQRRRNSLEDRIESLEGSLGELENEISDLETEYEEVIETITELESEVGEIQPDDNAYNRVLDLHETVTETESKLRRKEAKREELETEIDEVQSEIADLEGTERTRKEHEDELKRLQTRIETIEDTIIEEFNEHMDTLLRTLEYDGNIARVWIEKRYETVRKGRSKEEEPIFDLHIVRKDDQEVAFEDTQGIEHLSQSEREVVGLVFALAGFLAHGVYEYCPFLLLDSVEAIDASRIADLVEHFRNNTDFLVATLLPEDSRPLIDEHDPETVVQVSDNN